MATDEDLQAYARALEAGVNNGISRQLVDYKKWMTAIIERQEAANKQAYDAAAAAARATKFAAGAAALSALAAVVLAGVEIARFASGGN